MDDDWPRELFVMEPEERNTGNIVFSPDGKTGASSSHNREGKYYLKLWNAQTGKVKYQTKVTRANDIEFSRDGSLLAHGTEDGRVRLWKFETDEEYILGEVGKREIDCIAFSAISDSLVFARMDRYIEVWDYRLCQQIHALSMPFSNKFNAFDTCVIGFLFNDEVVVLFSGYYTDVWKIYLLCEEGTKLDCIVEGEAPAGSTTNFSVSRNGHRVLISNRHLVEIWDARTGRLSPKLIACGETETGDRGCFATAFSPGDRFFAISSWDHTVRVWDSVTHTQILSFRCDQGTPRTIALSHDGSILASGSLDGVLRLWDIAVDRPHTEIANPEAKMTYPFGIEIITNTQNTTTMLRNKDTGSCRFYTEDFESLEFLKQGKLIALILRATTLNETKAHLLSMDLERQSSEFCLRDIRGVIVSSSNGEKLAVLGEEHVWILDAGLLEELSIPLPGTIHGVQFSPDCQFIGLIFSHGVEIWDLRNKKRTNWLTELPNKPAIKFSPKSDAVAIWGKNGRFESSCCMLKVWKTSVPYFQHVNECIPPSDGLQRTGSLIYSANGDYIVMQTLQEDHDTVSRGLLRATFALVTYNLATGLIKTIPCAVGLTVPAGQMAAWSELIAIAPNTIEKPVIVVINCNTGERICTFDTTMSQIGLIFEEMSFSSDGQYLNLDRGQVLIPVDNRPPTTEMYCLSNLWIGEEWIFQRGRKLLWIPPKLRYRRMSVQYDEIWVYPRSGVVGPIAFFKLDLGKTPFAAEVPPEGEGFRYDEQERVMYLR